MESGKYWCFNSFPAGNKIAADMKWRSFFETFGGVRRKIGRKDARFTRKLMPRKVSSNCVCIQQLRSRCRRREALGVPCIESISPHSAAVCRTRCRSF